MAFGLESAMTENADPAVDRQPHPDHRRGDSDARDGMRTQSFVGSELGAFLPGHGTWLGGASAIEIGYASGELVAKKKSVLGNDVPGYEYPLQQALMSSPKAFRAECYRNPSMARRFEPWLIPPTRSREPVGCPPLMRASLRACRFPKRARRALSKLLPL